MSLPALSALSPETDAIAGFGFLVAQIALIKTTEQESWIQSHRLASFQGNKTSLDCKLSEEATETMIKKYAAKTS